MASREESVVGPAAAQLMASREESVVGSAAALAASAAKLAAAAAASASSSTSVVVRSTELAVAPDAPPKDYYYPLYRLLIRWKQFALPPSAPHAALLPPPDATTTTPLSHLLASLAGDVSSMLGCVLGLSEGLTALYVGIPCCAATQLFCAVHAARHSAHADLALAIIAGLNISAVSVAVGVPWLVGALYWAAARPTAESAVAPRATVV